MKLQSLELDTNGSSEPIKLGYWERQFLEKPTKTQVRFDWAYGVVIPLICFAADPIVFRDYGMLSEYKIFAYILSVTSIMTMAAWLLWGERLRGLAALLGGLFIAGSLISFVVGVVLFPISFIAMFFLIGFLGFTPLFTGAVYFRNGVRAIRTSGKFIDRTTVWHAAGLGALLALVIPYVVNGPMSWTVRWY